MNDQGARVFGFVELYAGPVYEGLTLYRYETCAKCGRDFKHSYVLLELEPRVWGYRCLLCSPGDDS